MKIKFLTTGTDNKLGFTNSCFVVDDKFLVNSGSSLNTLTQKQLLAISHIFLTDIEWSAIQDIPQHTEQKFLDKNKTLQIVATNSMIEALKTHLFNNRIWPEYQNLVANGTTGQSILGFHRVQGQFEIEGYKIECVATKAPDKVNFLFDDGEHKVYFAESLDADKKLLGEAPIRALFTSLHYPSDLQALAEAKHKNWLRKLLDFTSELNTDTPVYIRAFAPNYFEELVKEFHTHSPENFHLLGENHEVLV